MPARIYAPNAPALFAEKRPIDAALARELAARHELLGSNLPMLYGLHDVSGYGDLAPRRYDALLRRASPRILEMLSTRYQIPPTGAVVYELSQPAPRARIVRQARVVAGEAASLAAVADDRFDPGAEVIVERTPAPAAADGPGAARDELSWLEMEPCSRLIRAELTSAGYLVLSDAHDPGWRATMNGVPAELLVANHALQAIALPAGRSAIALRYPPSGLRIGVWIAMVAVAAVTLLVAIDKKRHQA
jgi:hypothetical protein